MISKWLKNLSWFSSLDSPIHARVFLTTNFKLALIIHFLLPNGQEQWRLMKRPKFIYSISTGLGKPLLVQSTSMRPLYNFSSIVSTLSCYIKTKPIYTTFYQNTLPLWNKMPSLIPSLIFLILYNSFPFLISSSRNID